MSWSVGNASVTRLLLDALKPREISTLEVARALVNLPTVSRVEINVVEVDARTETLKINISGRDINLKEVEAVLEKLATVIRSIDYVVAEK